MKQILISLVGIGYFAVVIITLCWAITFIYCGKYDEALIFFIISACSCIPALGCAIVMDKIGF